MPHATTLKVLSLVHAKLDTKTMKVLPMVDKYALTLKNVLTKLITVSTMPLVQIILVALHAHVIVGTSDIGDQACLDIDECASSSHNDCHFDSVAKTMVTLVHAKMDLRVMNSIVLISMNA